MDPGVEIKPIIDTGGSMLRFMEELFPLCRSITGDGTRETLHRIGERIPLEISEIPTGTKVFDWEIPKEWNIHDAYVKDPDGKKILDLKTSNLHVLNYSAPIYKHVDLATLKKHIYTLPSQPSVVPYRTSYYKEDWGFCMSHNQLLALQEGDYEVYIDSTLAQGSLTYGEVLIKGSSAHEMLISTHTCHPSLCNDNLSGMVVCTALAEYLTRERDLYYSYRFLFIPGTIGAIAWLSQNEDKYERIKYGLVTSLLGLNSLFTYKRSRAGHERIDRIVEHVIKMENRDHEIIDFIPYGYDERQFCSPGVDLPVGNLCRVPYGQYPEYHTSADNLDLISCEGLVSSYEVLKKVVVHIENDRKYMNLFPKGEPQLGKRGLYDHLGGGNDGREFQMALLWVLNFSDGKHTITDIAIRSGMNVEILHKAVLALLKNGLVRDL